MPEFKSHYEIGSLNLIATSAWCRECPDNWRAAEHDLSAAIQAQKHTEATGHKTVGVYTHQNDFENTAGE